jgi:hypothetical protein
MPDDNVHWLTSPLPETLDANALEACYFYPEIYDKWITEVCRTNILNIEDDNYIIPDNTHFVLKSTMSLSGCEWMKDLRLSTEAHIFCMEQFQNANFVFHHFDIAATYRNVDPDEDDFAVDADMSPLAAFVTDDKSMNGTFSKDLFAKDEEEDEMLMHVANDVASWFSVRKWC